MYEVIDITINKSLPEVKVLKNGKLIGYASMYDLETNSIGGCERVMNLPKYIQVRIEHRLLMAKNRNK